MREHDRPTIQGLSAALVLAAALLPACKERERGERPSPAAPTRQAPVTTGAELPGEERAGEERGEERADAGVAADAGGAASDAGAAAQAPEARPSWVPRWAPLTIVSAADRARNLGLVPPEGARVEVLDAGLAAQVVTTLRCP